MMDHGERLIDIEYLVNLRRRLEEDIINVEEHNFKIFLSSLLDVLLVNNIYNHEDIKKRGVYKALLFGVDHPDIFKEAIGVEATGLIRKDSNYLIKIERM